MTDTGGRQLMARGANEADLDGILELAAAFYAEDGFSTSSAELRHNLGVLLAADAARTAVVEIDGQPAAFAITTTSFGLEDGLIAELEDLFVVGQLRRRGLGRLLIEDSVRWAQGLGAHHLELVVAPQGRDVSRLDDYYRRHGFHDDGRRLLSRPLRPAAT